MSPLRLKAGNKFGATEKQEQAAIVKLLRSIGASVYVLGTVRRKGDHPGTMQTPGLPDLWVFLPQSKYETVEPLWIEVKARGGKLSVDQKIFKAHAERSGVDHLVGGLDDVIDFLQSGGWLK